MKYLFFPLIILLVTGCIIVAGRSSYTQNERVGADGTSNTTTLKKIELKLK